MTELKIKQHQDNEGWYWYRGTLQISLKNSGTHRWQIKVSAQQPELAMQRVLDAVNTTLKTELRQVIIQYGYPNYVFIHSVPGNIDNITSVKR